LGYAGDLAIAVLDIPVIEEAGGLRGRSFGRWRSVERWPGFVRQMRTASRPPAVFSKGSTAARTSTI
jgi:hypothetical protein